jgi:hypothetical protein
MYLDSFVEHDKVLIIATDASPECLVFGNLSFDIDGALS